MAPETPVQPQRRDRRRDRHEATKQEILDQAWSMVRADGLAALSLRALAHAIDMEPQSLYTYFASKNALYDHMFADGNRELASRFSRAEIPAEPRAALRAVTRLFVAFAAEDQARYQLLFLRTAARIPAVTRFLRDRRPGHRGRPGPPRAGRDPARGRLRPLDRDRGRPGQPAARQRPRRRPLHPPDRRRRHHVRRPRPPPRAATARQDLTRLSAGSRRASTAARPAPLRSRPASRAGRARSYFLGRYRSRSRARSVFPLRSLTIATFLARSRSARPISPLAMRNSASSR